MTVATSDERRVVSIAAYLSTLSTWQIRQALDYPEAVDDLEQFKARAAEMAKQYRFGIAVLDASRGRVSRLIRERRV